jgi:GTP cyclohydrolase II
MPDTYKRFVGASSRLPSRTWGELSVTSIDFTDAVDGDLMVVIGEPDRVERPLVRVHSECVFAEVFDSALCDCADQLHMALARIRKEGHGVLFYLRLDGRGAGLAAKVRATALEINGMDTYDSRVHIGVAPESRSFTKIGEKLLGMGLRRIRLMTNNPGKAADLRAAGIEVVVEALKVEDGDENIRRLYATKAQRFGHTL